MILQVFESLLDPRSSEIAADFRTIFAQWLLELEVTEGVDRNFA